ncbi:enoyl-CoA hydratase/isomerase family protein [Granulicella arctica]|uniref:enoyl-CoA hydratase/isomerase family protein n=1 Tax=Granulicella arctica TaxID=940613 RepID=UPI0021DFA526|nr:enoyl-CoA hydratase/isomerase family protein [Granulicella arctica]
MKFVHLEFSEQIATVTLDHPAGNRINFQMREELLEAFGQVATSDSRVLLVKAQGRDFCLGGDIRDWPGLRASELQPRLEVFAKAIDVLDTLTIPTLAVVQGRCMGGGFELALSCDLIIASTSAGFMFPEALLGITTLQGGVYRLAERIGRNKAMEMVLLSEMVEATRMAEWNVVNKVVDEGRLITEAETLARRLASGSPQAYAATKSLLQVWQQEGASAARAALYEITMPLFETTAVQSALRTAVEAISLGQPIPSNIFASQSAEQREVTLIDG